MKAVILAAMVSQVRHQMGVRPSPPSEYFYNFAKVIQWPEIRPCKAKAVSSNLTFGSSKN